MDLPPTSYKRPPLIHVTYFLQYLNKISKPCFEVRVDDGGELERCMEFTYLLICQEVNMQTTGGHSSWLNGMIERPHQTTTKLMREELRDSDQDDNKWCFALEATMETYNSLLHSDTAEQPHYSWYRVCTDINHLRVCGCEIFPLSPHPAQLSDRVQRGYFMGYTTTRAIIKWWNHLTN